MMGIKFSLMLLADMLFPLLQPGQGGGGPRQDAPITEAIILLLAGALGIGIKTFSKKVLERACTCVNYLLTRWGRNKGEKNDNQIDFRRLYIFSAIKREVLKAKIIDHDN